MKTYNEFKKNQTKLYEARMKDAMVSVYNAIEKLGHKSTVDNIVKQTKLDKNFVQDAIKYWVDDKKITKMGSGRQTHWMIESVELDEKVYDPMYYDAGMNNISGMNKFIDAMTKAKITVTSPRKGVAEVFPKQGSDRQKIFKAAERYGMIAIDESVELGEKVDWGKMYGYIATYKGKELRIKKNEADGIFAAKRFARRHFKIHPADYNKLTVEPAMKESVELDEATTWLKWDNKSQDGQSYGREMTLKILKAAGYPNVDKLKKKDWKQLSNKEKQDIQKVLKTKVAGSYKLTESVELEEKPFLKKIKMDKFSRSERKRKKENIKKIRKYNKMVGIPLASSYDAESVEEEISTTTSSVGTLTDPVERGVTPKKKKRKCEIEKFIGSRVFEVSNEEYCRCLKGRNKYERWNKYFDTESVSGSSIKKYSHKHPNNPIIIKDEKTGEMMFLRRRLNDNRLRHNKRNN